MFHFMDHDYTFWGELYKRFYEEGGSVRSEDLIKEVLDLRKKVSFYESRIEELHKVMMS